MSGHHFFSPSTHFRAFACPASVLLSAKVPYVEREDASEGTRIHALLARFVVSSGSDCSPEKDGDSKHIVNAANFIGQAVAEAGRGEWTAEMPLIFFRETGDGKTKVTAYTGTADAVLIVGKRGYILDWKTGERAQERDAQASYQLRAYAAALCQSRGLESASAVACYTATGEYGESVTVSSEDLGELSIRFSSALDAIAAPNPKFAETTGAHCQFCRVPRSECQTWRDESLAAARKVSALVANVETRTIATLEQADDFLVRCATIDAMLDPLRERAKDMIRAAGGSENWHVGKPVSTRRTDWKAVVAAANVPQPVIEQHTTVTTGEPRITRRKS